MGKREALDLINSWIKRYVLGGKTAHYYSAANMPHGFAASVVEWMNDDDVFQGESILMYSGFMDLREDEVFTFVLLVEPRAAALNALAIREAYGYEAKADEADITDAQMFFELRLRPQLY